jgi:pilus assembly protein CpaB
MRRGRLLIFVVLILIVGLGVVFAALTLFAPAAPQSTQTAVTEIYYAAQNIPQGAQITPELLGKFAIPSGNVAEVMFTVGEEANLVGQTARFTLEQGVIISSSMVGSKPVEISGPAWAVQIPSGMVAVTIPTNRLSTVGFGVNDGAHVNVNACLIFVDIDPAFQSILPNITSVVTGTGFPADGQPILSASAVSGGPGAVQGRVELDPTLQQPFYAIPSEAQRPRMVCQMILQDKVVMKLGNFGLSAPSADPNATPSPAQAQQQASPDIITLMVDPQDSIYLNYLVYNGAILTMTLRNPNDTSRLDTQAATLTNLLTQYGISLPSKLPYAIEPRIDILVPPNLPNDNISAQP